MDGGVRRGSGGDGGAWWGWMCVMWRVCSGGDRCGQAMHACMHLCCRECGVGDGVGRFSCRIVWSWSSSFLFIYFWLGARLD